MGGVGVFIRAGCRGGASLFALGGQGFGAEGILCGAESPVSCREKFAFPGSVERAILHAGSLFLAHCVCASRPRKGRRIPGRREGAADRVTRPFRDAGTIPRVMEAATQDEAAIHAQAISTIDSAFFYQPAPGGCPVRRATQPNQLMILIPAFNEEGAVADVIREVNEVMPRVPVLVADDASRDDTYRRAKSAGADV